MHFSYSQVPPTTSSLIHYFSNIRWTVQTQQRVSMTRQHSPPSGCDTNVHRYMKQNKSLQHKKMELTSGFELWTLPSAQWEMTQWDPPLVLEATVGRACVTTVAQLLPSLVWVSHGFYGPAACAPVVTNIGKADGTPSAQQRNVSRAEGWARGDGLLLLLLLLYHSACMFYGTTEQRLTV